jgi:hypothetical protein
MHLDEKNSTDETPKKSEKPNPKLKLFIDKTMPQIVLFTRLAHSTSFCLGKI